MRAAWTHQHEHATDRLPMCPLGTEHDGPCPPAGLEPRPIAKVVQTVGELRAALGVLPGAMPLKITGCYHSEVNECDVWLVTERVAAHVCPTCKTAHEETTKATLVLETGLSTG